MSNSSARPARRRSRVSARTRPAVRSRTKIKERRKKSSERRCNEAIAQFPIITTQGICVRRDRRKIPDRRMSNIVVREAKLKEEVFDTLFSNYLKYKERIRLQSLRRSNSS